jgi:hypothetical protein
VAHGQLNLRIVKDRRQDIMQLTKLRIVLRQVHQRVAQKPCVVGICYDKRGRPRRKRVGGNHSLFYGSSQFRVLMSHRCQTAGTTFRTETRVVLRLVTMPDHK